MSSGAKRRPGAPPLSADHAAALTAVLTDLLAGIECLCQNVSGLRADLAAHRETVTAHGTALGQDAEQATLLRHRLDRLDGRLDGFERYLLAVDPRYPRDRHGGFTPLAAANGRHR